MGLRSDSGQKFDQGKQRQVLALVEKMNDTELGLLINELRTIQRRRQSSHFNNDTIKL